MFFFTEGSSFSSDFVVFLLFFFIFHIISYIQIRIYHLLTCIISDCLNPVLYTLYDLPYITPLYLHPIHYITPLYLHPIHYITPLYLHPILYITPLYLHPIHYMAPLLETLLRYSNDMNKEHDMSKSVLHAIPTLEPYHPTYHFPLGRCRSKWVDMEHDTDFGMQYSVQIKMLS